MNVAGALVPMRARFFVKRFSIVHKPLRWLNRVALPTIAEWLLGALRSVIPSAWNIGLPRGIFSALHDIETGHIEGRLVLSGQGSPQLPSPSIMVLCNRKQHLEQPWPIFWSRHKCARLIGRSLAHINAQRRICAEAVYGRERVSDDPAYFHFVLKPVHLQGPWTSVISRFSPNHGAQTYAHWLLDALPRLALLSEFPAGTRVLIPPHQLPYQTQSLELLGLLSRCRPTAEGDISIEDYFFSSPTSMIVCHNPYAVRFLRHSFLQLASRQPSTPPRFFVRRTSFGRNMINEDEVMDFFSKIGWTIVDAAQMTFWEQIALFAGAEAVCAIHGSATANIVWCSAGCKVIELFADTYLAGDQEWIAQCVSVDYHFMLFASDHMLNADVNVAQLKQKLVALGLM
jgi:hypothetical protein